MSENDNKNEFFTMLPRSLMRRENLSLNWKVALGYMTTRLRLGFWLLCAADVCNETGVSKAEVSRLFAALEAHQSISYERTRSIGAKRFKEYNGTVESLTEFAETYSPAENPQFQGETAAVSVRNCEASAVSVRNRRSFGTEPIRRIGEEVSEEEGMKEEVRTKNTRKGSGNQSAEPKAVSPSAPIQGSTLDEVWDQIPTFTSSSAEGSVDEFRDMELSYSASMASRSPVTGYAETAQERLSAPAHPDSLATGENLAVEPYTLKSGHPNLTLLQGAINRIHERLASGEKITFRSLLQRHPANLNGLLIGEYEEKAKELSKRSQ